MSKSVDALSAYLAKRETKYVDIDELGAEGEPLRLYYKPFTTGEMIQVQKQHKDISTPEALIDLIVKKALDADGEKVFTIEHKMMLKQLPPELIYKMATPMMLVTDVEDMAGN